MAAYKEDCTAAPPPYEVAVGLVDDMPQPAILPRDPPLRKWNYDIFGCFNDLSTCLLTYFCPYITMFIIGDRIGAKSLGVASAIFFFLFQFCICTIRGYRAEADVNVVPASMLNIMQIMTGFLFFFYVMSRILLRMKVREKGRIMGSSAEDCFFVACCVLCSICQEKQEVDDMSIQARV